MSAGGKHKGLTNSPNLTPIDVRRSIANVAGTGTANVDKVRTILQKAHPNTIRALQVARLHTTPSRACRRGRQARGSRDGGALPGKRGSPRLLQSVRLSEVSSLRPAKVCDERTNAMWISLFFPLWNLTDRIGWFSLLIIPSRIYCVPMKSKFHWRGLLPSRWSIAIMVFVLAVAEYLRYKGIVLFHR